MFQLAVMLWTMGRMIYPTKFSVMYNVREKTCSIRAFIKNDKYVTENYMSITPFMAINGEIFENDVIIIGGNEDELRLCSLMLKRVLL